MQIIHTVLITLSIALVNLNCHCADLEDNRNIETSLHAKNVDKEVGDLNNKRNHQASDTLGEKVQNNSNHNSHKDSIKVFGLNETGNKKKKETDSDKVGDNIEKANNGSHGEIDQRTIEPERKAVLQDECDSSSNSCEIVDYGLVACLRVPGNESPDLSLLIQNKGKGTATVTISAPAFVHLETNQIDVPRKENKKVKVSIVNKGTGSAMVLKSRNGNCSIDFKELINQGTLKYISTSQITGINISNSTSIVWILVLVAFLVVALLGTFICLWRKQKRSGSDNKPNYEMLETESPVSSGSKKISESKEDGWDDNWDDSWDDVEAQKTSYVPVTSSLSQDAITPRRINKEGWKD